MKLLKSIILLLITLPFISSCEDGDDYCPTHYKVLLYVKDKNYFSPPPTEPKVSESLPFKEYVKNIYYTLQEAESNALVQKSGIIDISNTDQEISLTLEDVPEGKYVLTVWGNIPHISNEPSIERLHTESIENTDLYIASHLLDFTGGVEKEIKLGMERTKGKLSIHLNNFPAEIQSISEEISSLYQSVSHQLVYSGNTQVRKSFLKNSQTLNHLSTYLAPTIESKKSDLRLSFFSKENTLLYSIPPVEINIRRNEVLPLEINYDPDQNAIEIHMFIDGEWELVHYLNLK